MQSIKKIPGIAIFLKNAMMMTVVLSGYTSAQASITNKSAVIDVFPSDTVKKMMSIPSQPQDISPLLNGENIPVVQLKDAEGNNFDLNASVASEPTILLFYRGGWCPYCSKQLSGMMDIEPDLKKMGYQIIAISTDSPENLKQTAIKQKLGYTLLSDADLAVAKQFGIAYKAPAAYSKLLPESSGGKNLDRLLPVPSVYILNKKGNIRFEYINPNFMERLNPQLLKAAAATLREEVK